MKKRFSGIRRVARGFTLIELLVVIAIIAILAAVLFPVFAKVREKAYTNACMNNQRQLALSILMKVQDANETFPLPDKWLEDLGLTDPKILDCPSNTQKGSFSEPDYGYNAFFFDTLMTGEVVPATLGNLDFPSKIELTSDINGPTGGVADPMTNPFPNAFVVSGFGPYRNGDSRHQSGAVISYLDGHVQVQRNAAMEIGTSPSRFGLPRSFGKIYIDFSKVADDAAADTLVKRLTNTANPGTLVNGAYNINAFALGKGTSVPLTGDTVGSTLRIEFELAPSARLRYHHAVANAATWPVAEVADVDGDGYIEGRACRLGMIFLVNNPTNEVVYGSKYAYSTHPLNQPTTTHVELPSLLQGKTDTLPTQPGIYTVQVDMLTTGTSITWPGEGSVYWGTRADLAISGSYIYGAYPARVTVDKDSERVSSYDGKVIAAKWDPKQYAPTLTPTMGVVRLRKLMYTVGR